MIRICVRLTDIQSVLNGFALRIPLVDQEFAVGTLEIVYRIVALRLRLQEIDPVIAVRLSGSIQLFADNAGVTSLDVQFLQSVSVRNKGSLRRHGHRGRNLRTPVTLAEITASGLGIQVRARTGSRSGCRVIDLFHQRNTLICIERDTAAETQCKDPVLQARLTDGEFGRNLGIIFSCVADNGRSARYGHAYAVKSITFVDRIAPEHRLRAVRKLLDDIILNDLGQLSYI